MSLFSVTHLSRHRLRPRQQRGHRGFGARVDIRQLALEQVLQISKRVEAVFFRRLHDAVGDRARPRPTWRIGEQPVLAANHERLDRPLAPVVVYLQVTIFQECHQFVPLFQAIRHRLPKHTLGGSTRGVFCSSSHAKNASNTGLLCQTTLVSFFWRGALKVPLKSEQPIAEFQAFLRGDRLLLFTYRQGLKCLFELSSRVCPIPNQLYARDVVVPRVSISNRPAPMS